MPSRPGAAFLPTNSLPAPRLADVTSAYGRIGDVVGEEGDYTIDQLADVDTTTTAPTSNNLLHWDGTNWVPTTAVDSGIYVGP